MTRRKYLISSILIIAFLFSSVRPAQAVSFTDVVNGVKDFFSGAVATVTSLIKKDQPKDLSLTSDISIGEDDIVTFSYVITNPTKNKYKLATLLTNISRNKLNFIHDVSGVTGLTDTDGTITLPNLLVPPQGEMVISFKARVNYANESVEIFTEPELISQDRKSLAKSEKKSIQVKPKEIKDASVKVQNL